MNNEEDQEAETKNEFVEEIGISEESSDTSSDTSSSDSDENNQVVEDVLSDNEIISNFALI